MENSSLAFLEATSRQPHTDLGVLPQGDPMTCHQVYVHNDWEDFRFKALKEISVGGNWGSLPPARLFVEPKGDKHMCTDKL